MGKKVTNSSGFFSSIIHYHEKDKVIDESTVGVLSLL